MAKKSVLERVEGSVERLIADHRRLSGVCQELTEQRDQLQRERREALERISSLEHELSKLQLCEGLAGADKSRERAKGRVNRLMREVDRCIALLNSPTTPVEDLPELGDGGGESSSREVKVGEDSQVVMELEFQSEKNDN